MKIAGILCWYRLVALEAGDDDVDPHGQGDQDEDDAFGADEAPPGAHEDDDEKGQGNQHVEHVNDAGVEIERAQGRGDAEYSEGVEEVGAEVRSILL